MIGETLEVTPEIHQYRFQTKLKPAKTGLLLVGIGGNNGSTVFGATIANRENMSWKTKYFRKNNLKQYLEMVYKNQIILARLHNLARYILEVINKIKHMSHLMLFCLC